ncbi:basic proline-rich protein-like [Myotis yumanensis]|uniref:basic proline-rich protein-like n=1 Tax=Myotis yumanensis TaxID=159337 RepID=UPI0038D439F2
MGSRFPPPPQPGGDPDATQPPPAPESSGRTAPGDRIRIPAAPPLGHPTPSLPAWAGEQPERSGLPPTPEPPTRASGAATAQLPRSARRNPAQRRDHGGNRRLLPELAAQPRRRPRPGLRGAEPRRGREDGGPEAGAQRSPAPPPPPAAGENCACRLAEARPPPLAAGARLGPRFLPSPPPVLGVLSSALVLPRPVFCPEVAPGPLRAFTAPAVRSPPPSPDRGCVPSRFGYPAQRGLRASRSGGSLPGSEPRRPPPLGRAQPQLPPAAAAAPPPGAAAALGRRLLLLLLWRRLWLLPAAPRGEKHKAQRPPPAGSPPAARPPAGPGLSSHTPRRRSSLRRRTSSPPRNPRRRGSLTERANGSAGQGHRGVRRAEEPSRSSAAAGAGAVSRQTKPEMAKRSDG